MSSRTMSAHTGTTRNGRLAVGVGQLRDRLAALAYRGQLGPSREDGWRDFMPRRQEFTGR